MKNTYFEYIIFSVIVLKVIITGITTTTQSFCDFYKYENPIQTKGFKYEKLVSSYTGFDTGYGFFAPNVSSNFLIISENTQTGNSYISTDLLSTKEGKLRFANLNDVYIKNVTTKDKNIPELKINHILLKQVNKNFKKKYGNNIITYAYLYDQPTLDSNKKETRLIKIDSIK
ncbi:hypothetical protein ACM39_17355 [Chryseobacterium sp. FH2]|uniref:hypothetical protein n=1 Tax=Chryseobacterium sp. FH2 TaxID=1674291 RepID=UPI00065AC67A|nr:hypothetical protein [Chryseobacterium sp. FH2]KMQ62886.1 hypothetical protein ACM39_17355 [Chryseobacterium sp. FH2]